MPSTPSPRRTPHRRDKDATPPSANSDRINDSSDQVKSKAEARKTGRQAVDVGRPLGPYDTNTVRDRVRQWQAQGGGVITADDIIAFDSDDECTAKVTAGKKSQILSPTRALEPQGQRSPTRDRSGGRKSKVEEEDRDRDRSGSSPRKRVVSDGHWRHKRSPPRTAITTGVGTNTASPRTILPDDGIRVKSIPQTPTSKVRRDTGVRTPSKTDKDIPLDGTPRSRSRHIKPRRGEEDMKGRSESRNRNVNGDTHQSSLITFTPTSNDEDVKHVEERTPERSPELDVIKPGSRSRKRGSSHQKQQLPEECRRISPRTAFSEERESVRSHTPKVSILKEVIGEGRKIFSRPEPQPPLAIPGNRIEAWLSDTSDPFLEVQKSSVEGTTKSSSDLADDNEATVAEERVSNEDEGGANIKISSELDGRIGNRRRRRVRSSMLRSSEVFSEEIQSGSSATATTSAEPAAKLIDIVSNPPELPSPTLKRTGAKRNVTSPTREPRKSSPLKEASIEGDAVASVASSSVIASSVDVNEPGLNLQRAGTFFKRPFPSTGRNRLSTIASVETFNNLAEAATAPSISEVSEDAAHDKITGEEVPGSDGGDTFNPNSMLELPGAHTGLKRRLTTHADLMSVLSLPRAGSKTIQSARSIRTNRSRLATATIGDLMREFTMDEHKYMRELRTLVDGVIPVLLTCVLSKHDSAVAAGLFSPSSGPQTDANITRPIVDMGIALERLKALHKRIPEHDPEALLIWARGAQRIYVEYLKSWRLGFQDVVVNLAPSTGLNPTADTNDANSRRQSSDQHSLYEGLPMNKDGDVVDSDGERVDVAFLLKRPLVRLKYLAKTLKGINYIKPSSEAESLTAVYQNLVLDARTRANEERARLEDEAASKIDPTRARDIRTLAPLAGVAIDTTRRVRARDYFAMDLHHSSGQRVDCRVELLLRDDAPDRGTSGDVLICEVDGTGRWLLFPPLACGKVSARNGDLKGEIVIMIRGWHGHGEEWQELFVLRTDDEQAGFEWVQMLGLTPVPPSIARTQSFVSKIDRIMDVSGLSIPTTPNAPIKSRTPSPREIEIPIGERARSASKIWEPQSPTMIRQLGADPEISPLPSLSNKRTGFQKKEGETLTSPHARRPSPQHQEVKRHNESLRNSSIRMEAATGHERTPRSLNEAMRLAGKSSSPGLRRTRAKRRSRHADESPANHKELSDYLSDDSQTARSPGTVEDERPEDREPRASGLVTSGRPHCYRSPSSVPSTDLPIIPKVRKKSPPVLTLEASGVEGSYDLAPCPLSPALRGVSKLTEKHDDKGIFDSGIAIEEGPAPPARDASNSVHSNSPKPPKLGSPSSAPRTHRRSSSPLKHEYAPSSASGSSSSASEYSAQEDNEVTTFSESSGDEELEGGDAPTPLLPMGALRSFSKVSIQGSLYSLPNGTLGPSQSASQAPYKTVPLQPAKASKTIASIFSWSDKGSWESLHPDECSIVITPGLIEAYEMSAAHSQTITFTSNGESKPSSPTQDGERPVVGLELTPLVPLRRGTALDITIRSPPTPHSKITSGNNILFRSRNPEECEALYALINTSRINNPTYIALQNARGPYGDGFASSMDRRNGSRAGSSNWWGLSRKSSYRASSGRTPSIAPSESSIGSFTSTFSALKRFGNGGRLFNVSRSTISSRNGSRSNSVYSSSSGSSSPLPLIDPNKGSPIGLSNAKIRIYERETASKWRDMGSARLTIMRPPPGGPIPGSPGIKPGSYTGQEKRILVQGKTKGECLLDVCLGENCFERVARTGIAMSVWEESLGPNGEAVIGAVGGVGGTKARVYMIQVRAAHRG
ncbi:MAG: hypothetical protein M1827_006701 [Pycnora praestabilis]|nr:MAG: hypothetical protein M1827_006701 [Pycnora praestabilis]